MDGEEHAMQRHEGDFANSAGKSMLLDRGSLMLMLLLAPFALIRLRSHARVAMSLCLVLKTV